MAKPTQTETVPITLIRNIAKEVAREVVLKELKKESSAIRQDFMLVFGLFASVLIFLSVEVQIFKSNYDLPFLLGVSLFILGSLQMFVLSLKNVFQKKISIKNDWVCSPILWITVACYVGAMISLWVGKYH